MLRVLREIDEGRGEVRTRDVVRTVREVFPSDLGSNPARPRPVREIRRSGRGAPGRARWKEAPPPGKIPLGGLQKPPGRSYQKTKAAPLPPPHTPPDETPDP